MDSHHYLANYEIEQEIGQGSFATVFLGHEKTTKVKVAVKAVSTAKLNKKLAENLASEITILKEIDHPNIIKLYEIQKTDNYIYLVMEYCEAGDLSQFLRKQPVMKEIEAKSLLQQLTSALKVLWEHNLIHRDLKPQNLLLQHDQAGELVIKIADFGFARYVEPSDLAETLCGSPLYMAPEILRYEKYDAKADLWSVGAIAYEMVFGAPPYRAENHVHLLKMIEAADDSALPFPSRVTIKQKLQKSQSNPSNSKFSKDKDKPISVTINIETSDIFRDLILKLLRKDPTRRISFEEYFVHPFLSETFSKPASLPINNQSERLNFIDNFAIESRRNSHSHSTVSSSTIDEVLKLDDENVLLFEPFENIERKPPLIGTVKNCLSLVLMIDKVIDEESNHSNSMSLSMSRISDQRKFKTHSILLLLYYNIDLLENCLELLKTAINRETERGTNDFSNLLKAARCITTKLGKEYELFDNVKINFKLHSTSNSSMSRSNSNQSVTVVVEEGTSSNPKIETLLLQAAFKSAKEGGIQELLDQNEEARSKYLFSQFLLKSLINPTELAPITSKFAQINQIPQDYLNRYLELIQDKIKIQ